MSASHNRIARRTHLINSLKRSRSKLALACVLVAGGLSAGTAQGQVSPAYWDTNGTTAGSGTTGGTWNASNTNWSVGAAAGNSGGTVATAAFPATNGAAIFAAGTNATGTYTVTVDGNLTIWSMNVQEGTITFNAGATPGSGLTVQNGAGAASGDAVAERRLTVVSTAVMNIPVTGGNVFKGGAGSLRFNNANTFSASFTIEGGTLIVGHNDALGNTAAGTLVGNGTTLSLPGGITLAEPLSHSNSGSTSTILNNAGSNTITGDITVQRGANINANSGTTLTVTGKVTGDTINASFVTERYTKGNPGTVIFTNANNDIAGIMAVNNGVASIAGTGAFTNTALTWAVGSGSTTVTTATLLLDNSDAAFNVADRLYDFATVSMGGNATLELRGNNTAAASETFGNLDLVGNANVSFFQNNFVQVNPGTAGATLTSSFLNRSAGGSVVFRGPNLGQTTGAGAGNVLFTSAPSVLGDFGGTGVNTPVMNGALADLSLTGVGSDFATYDAVKGVRPLAASEYVANIPDGSTSQVNVVQTGAATLTMDTLINSLKFSGPANLTIDAGKTLTVNSGMFLAREGGTISGGTVNLGFAEGFLHADKDLTISSAIVGGNGLTKPGPGVLRLSGNSNYFGTTFIQQGVLVAASDNALGSTSSATSVALGASLQLDGSAGNITVAENVDISGAFNLALQGTGFGASDRAQGSLHNITGDNTISGTVTLWSTGSTQGDAGLTVISVASGSSLTLTGTLQSNSGGVGSTWAKAGPGTLVIAPTFANSYNSLVRIFGGVTVLETNGALGAGGGLTGTTTNGTFMLDNSNTTVAFGAGVNYSVTEFINMQGWGYGELGGIDSLTGNNIFGGFVALAVTVSNYGQARPNYIGVREGSTLDITGGIGAYTSAGALNTTGRNMVKIGKGTLILSAADNPMSGSTDIVEGTISLAGSGSIKPPNTALPNEVNVFPGASLIFDNTTILSTDRLKGGGTNVATLNLFGGELKLIGASFGSTVQGLPTATTNLVGNPTLTAVSNGVDLTRLDLELGARAAGGVTPFVRGTDLGGTANQIANNVAPTLSGTPAGTGAETPIVAWAVGANSATSGPTDFVTYDNTTGFKVLTAAEYAALNLAGGVSANNVTVGAGGSLGANGTVNSLKFDALGATLNLGGFDLNVTSGAILAAQVGTSTGTTIVSNGKLAFGTAEAIITTGAGHTVALNAEVTGSGGLTKSGEGTLSLNNSSNAYTGVSTINGGILQVETDAALGNADNDIVIAGGSLRPGSLNTALGASRTVALTSRTGGFDIPATQIYTVGSTISGQGMLTKTGPGTLVLTGTNTHKGGTTVREGVLSVSDVNNLGDPIRLTSINSTIMLDGGTLQFTSSVALGNRPFLLGKNGGTIDVQGAGTVVSHDISGATTQSPFGGPGSLTKTGPGLFEFLTNVPTYGGGTYVKEGTLRINFRDTMPGASYGNFVSVEGGRFLLNFASTSTTQMTNIEVYLRNGGTLAATQSPQFNRAGWPQVDDGANVSLEAVGAADSLNLLSALTNSGPAASKPTINIIGAGVVSLATNPADTFLANWNVDGGTLRVNNQNAALGNQANTLTFAPAGGTVQIRASTLAKTYNNPVAIGGNATFVHQSTTGTGGGPAFAHTFGTLAVNADATIAMTAPSGTNGINAGNPGLIFGATTLAGSPTFDVSNPAAGGGTGSITIGNFTESGGARNITKAGTGDLILGGTGVLTGALNVNAGRVQSAGGTSKVGALNFGGATDAWTGAFDVKENGLVIASGTTTLANIQNQARQGRNNGAWTGAGINSSNAAADARKITGVGAIVNNNGSGSPILANLDGQPAALDEILLKYTYNGDSDFNGVVDATDYFQIDAGFLSQGTATPKTGWRWGDYDYNGLIDIDDYFLIDNAYSKQSGPLGGVPAAMSAVPEPAALSLLALGAMALLGRRRRSR